MPEDPVGIQVGTAITTLVRKADHSPAKAVGFRHLWGQAKREELMATALVEPSALYDSFEPSLGLGLPFTRMAVGDGWHDWPSLTDLFPASFPGVKTSRDSFLIDVDLHRLRARISDYFDSDLSHEEVVWRHPAVMSSARILEARAVREKLLRRGGPLEHGFLRYVYRPYDIRWLYWEGDSGLLDRPRTDYKSHVLDGNLWLEAREKEAREDFSRGTFCRHLADNFGNGLSSFFPLWLHNDSLVHDMADGFQRSPNLSNAALSYLDGLCLGVEDLFHHVLAVLHDPAYREANAGALRLEWPRIPLPGWPNGDEDGAVPELAASAARGRELAALLDSDTPVPGVTEGALCPAIAYVAVPSTVDGGNMAGDDFALTASWGHHGQGEAVMPGQGRVVERPYTMDERAAIGEAVSTLGETTFDIYLNDRAYWRNVPAAVWSYKLGGYQVLKKWLSYRERKVLGRVLLPEEVQHFTDTARRIAAILLVTVK